MRKKQHLGWAALAGGVVCGVMGWQLGCDSTADAKPGPRFVLKSPVQDKALAKVGDRVLTEDELIGSQAMDFLAIERKRYDMLVASVRQQAVDTLIGAEAAKAKQPLETYLDQKVAVLDKGAIKPEEVAQFMKERNVPEGAEVRGRVEAYLLSQKKKEKIDAYLARLTQKQPIELYFKKPVLKSLPSWESSPWDGKKDAPVQVVVISDFQCPFCARGADTVRQVKAKYKDQVALIFKHYPLPFHPDALPVAEASMCAFEQGDAFFWKFHDAVFREQASVFKNHKLDEAALNKLVQGLRLNVERYKACVTAKKYASAVQADIEAVQKLGVTGTPLFLINGSPLSGAVGLEAFATEIEDALMEKAALKAGN